VRRLEGRGRTRPEGRGASAAGRQPRANAAATAQQQQQQSNAGHEALRGRASRSGPPSRQRWGVPSNAAPAMLPHPALLQPQQQLQYSTPLGGRAGSGSGPPAPAATAGPGPAPLRPAAGVLGAGGAQHDPAARRAAHSPAPQPDPDAACSRRRTAAAAAAARGCGGRARGWGRRGASLVPPLLRVARGAAAWLPSSQTPAGARAAQTAQWGLGPARGSSSSGSASAAAGSSGSAPPAPPSRP